MTDIIDRLRVSIEERDLVSVFLTGEPGIFPSNVTWNDLMPVVEKVNNIKANQHPSMDSVHARRKVINMPICSDIKDVWNNVIQFIQWYNKQTV